MFKNNTVARAVLKHVLKQYVRRGLLRRLGCFKTCVNTIGKTLKQVLNPVIMVVGQTLTCKSNRYIKNRALPVLPRHFFLFDRWGVRIAARGARPAAAPCSAAASWGRGAWVVLKHVFKTVGKALKHVLSPVIMVVGQT